MIEWGAIGAGLAIGGGLSLLGSFFEEEPPAYPEPPKPSYETFAQRQESGLGFQKNIQWQPQRPQYTPTPDFMSQAQGPLDGYKLAARQYMAMGGME